MASDPYALYDSLQNETAAKISALAIEQKADLDVYVVENMQPFMDRMIDTKIDQWRPADATDTRWEENRRRPALREYAYKKLLEETPPEAWAKQQQHFRQQGLAKRMYEAKVARINELRPAIQHDIKKEKPDLADPDLESEIRRRLNSVLGSEGFNLVPTDPKIPFIRELHDELGVAFPRGGANIISSLQAYWGDIQGQLHFAAGNDKEAERHFRRAEAARRWGAKKQEQFRPSEGLEGFQPGKIRWWISNLGENLPQFALMLSTGHAAGAIGKSLGMTGKALRTLQVAASSAAIGNLEAAGAYEGALTQLRAKGLSLAQARDYALVQSVAVGITNTLLESIPAGLYFGKLRAFKNRLGRAVLGALTEGATEPYQEITAIMGEAYALARAKGYDIPASLLAMGKFRGKGERIATTIAVGLGLGGIGGAATSAAPSGPKTAAPTDFAPSTPGVAPAPTGLVRPGLDQVTTVSTEEGPTILPFPGEEGPTVLPMPTEEEAVQRDVIPFPLERTLTFPEAARELALVPPEARVQPEPPSPIPFPREAAEAAPVAAPEAPVTAPDITETERDTLRRELTEEKRLRRVSVVTKGPNIVAHREAAEVIFAEADKTGESVGIVRTDLGNFKVVNDRLGHAVGDQLLQAEAEAFAEGLRMPPQRGRPSDYAGNMSAQVGGDEFGAFVRGAASSADAAAAMDRVTTLFDEKATEIIGDRLPKTAYPFIAWGAEIREAGDPRSLTELEAVADKAQQVHKDALKAERGIPPTREALAEYIATQQAETAKKTGAEIVPSETTPEVAELSEPAKAAIGKVGPIELASTGSDVTSPAATFEQGARSPKKTGKNVWVRQAPKGQTANEGRVLLVQFASDLIQEGDEKTGLDAYHEKLHRTRPGYARAETPDTVFFWELPEWMGQAARNIPDADVYVIRNMEEALAFLDKAGYDQIAFSVLNVNQALVEQIATAYKGDITVGGYVDLDALAAGHPHVTAQKSIKAWVEALGQEHQLGLDYRHFAGTHLQPRLSLSTGCKYKCAFCTVEPRGKVVEVPMDDVLKQARSFEGLDFTHVYINDKTFGQAKNHAELGAAYDLLKQQNPSFQGFVVQTTAADFLKLDADLLKRAGIRYIEIGMESYNDAVVLAAKKPQSRVKFVDQAVKKARKHGLALIPNLMIGLPGETQETYNRTLRFLDDNQDIISHINAYNLALYEGTAMAEQLKADADIDVNENVVAKSFHEDPALHEGFAARLAEYGMHLLDNPALGVVDPPLIQNTNAITEDLTDPDLSGRDPVGDTKDSPAKKIASARLGDRSGHIDAAMLNALLVGVPGMAGEAGRMGARLHRGLIDQGAVLRASSRQGSQAMDFYQAAHNLRSRLAGRWSAWFYRDALNKLPRRKRGTLLRWMNTLREDGQTNWSTFIEHPDRMAGETLPAGAEAVREGFLKGYRDAGLRSETERLPQMQYKVGPKGGVSVVLGPFKRAATPRYARHLSTAGRSAFQNRTGETWDAVVDWLIEHPDRNPGIPGSSKEIEAYVADRERELEASTQKFGAVRKARSFAHVRLFQELPVAVTTVSGKVVEIQVRKPIAHMQMSFLEQASQLALWQIAREELLPLYGRYQKETGELIYPLGAEALGIMDAESLIERLRNTVVRGARVDPAAARKAFDTTHDNYTGPNFTGRTDEMLSAFNDTTLGRAATTPVIWSKAGVLSLSGFYDLIDWTKALPGTGLRGLRGFFKAQAQVAAHPITYAAEYRAMGVLPTLHNVWTVYRDTAGSDILRGGVARTLMRGAQATEHWKQFSIAKMHEEWLAWFPEHPGRISKAQADYMRNIMRLTPKDIAAINAGEMTPRIRAKALQNAVNSIAGLTEAAINKGMLQNSMVWRFLVPFTSVVSGTTRMLAGMGRSLASNVRIIVAKGQPSGAKIVAAKALAGGLLRVLGLVAAIAGTGFLQRLLRRIAKARPLVDPEDPKTWEMIFAEALAEGGVWGPYGRLIDAYLYSDGDLRLMLPNLSFPLATVAEFATAAIGWGPYQDTEWTERLHRLGTRYLQVYSVAQNWLDRVAYPDRQRMAVARKYVRVWRKEQGEDVEFPRGRRNRHYYAVYEAIRDGDDEALREAKVAYKAWAREKGWTLSDARQNLEKSLNSRRPINLNPKRQKAFLSWLPEDKRNGIEDIDKHYRQAVAKATRKPGPPEPPEAPKPAKPPKPGEPGFWGNWSSRE